MPAATISSAGKGPGAVTPGSVVPFLVGSNQYSEKIFTDTFQLGATQNEFVHNITPGGFLRGVRLLVRSTGGVLGSGTITADNPFNVISNITLENIDGSPIKYPMGGYSYYLENKYGKPWAGDPAKKYDYAQGINPSFTLRIFPEIRDSAGSLANTDARAQYRIRYSLAPTATIASGSVGTAPTITVTGFLETWAQTDSQDLHGNPIAAIPDGLAIGSILRQDIKTLNGVGADNIFQFANTGNEYRCIILVVRDSNNARQDYLTDPIRFRLDDRSEFVQSPDDLFQTMTDHYDFLGQGTSSRETGVYVIPRFRKPGQLQGSFWMPTSNASYVVIQSTTSATASNVPGTLQIITDEVVPIQTVPIEMEGI